MEYLRSVQHKVAEHLSLPSAVGYSNVPTSYGATTENGLQTLPSDATKIEPKVSLSSRAHLQSEADVPMSSRSG